MFGFFTVNPAKKLTEQPAKIVHPTSVLRLFLFLLLNQIQLKCMLSYLPVFKEIRYGWYYFRNRNLQYKFRFNQLNLVKFSLGKEIHRSNGLRMPKKKP